MTAGDRATRLLLLAANIAWFGGLFRLIGEALSAVLARVARTDGELQTWAASLIVALVLVGVIEVALWRWPPYRSFVWQTRQDIRSLYGLRPEVPGQVLQSLRRSAAASVIVVAPAIVVAAVLPGVIAAAAIMVVGLVLRVGVVVAVAGSRR